MQQNKKSNNVMETETIQKNEARPKSLMSRGNFLNTFTRILYFAIFFLALTACDKNNNDSPNNPDNPDNPTNNSGKWVKKKNYPGNQNDYPIAFSINNKVYALSSYTNHYLWEYDPTNNTWTEKKQFPGTTTPGTCFVIGNKAYIITAYSYYGADIQMWEYNSETDNWTQKTDCPVKIHIASVSAKRVNFAFSINNKGYAGSQAYDFYEYNPETDSWKQCVNFPQVYSNDNINRGAGGIAHGSTGQNGFTVGGGYGMNYSNGSLNNWRYKTFCIYNPITNQWTVRADFPIAIEEGISFCKNGVIYAGLGITGTNENDRVLPGIDSKKIYKFDNDNNSWSFALEAPIEGGGKIAVMCNGKLYIGLGGTLELWEYTF